MRSKYTAVKYGQKRVAFDIDLTLGAARYSRDYGTVAVFNSKIMLREMILIYHI